MRFVLRNPEMIIGIWIATMLTCLVVLQLTAPTPAYQTAAMVQILVRLARDGKVGVHVALYGRISVVDVKSAAAERGADDGGRGRKHEIQEQQDENY